MKVEGMKIKLISPSHGIIQLAYNGRKVMIRQSRVPLSSGLLSYLADYKGATYDLLDFCTYNLELRKTPLKTRVLNQHH